MPGKILTCCYCGARSLFAPGAGATLSCETCGAPLKEQKPRPLAKPKTVRPDRSGGAAGPVKAKKSARKAKKKRRKPLFRKVLSEAFDLIEDIFD